MMKNLIIHPQDRSTDFLSPIYADIEDKTVIRGGISKTELRGLIETHDRIIMLGHGCPYGLLNPGQFDGAGMLIIDETMVPELRTKSSCIYIWCYADQFVKRHGLIGLSSGMFISESGEAAYFGFKGLTIDMISQSNDIFAEIVAKFINDPIDILYRRLKREYGLLARNNSIARFNLTRLCNFTEESANSKRMSIR